MGCGSRPCHAKYCNFRSAWCCTADKKWHDRDWAVSEIPDTMRMREAGANLSKGGKEPPCSGKSPQNLFFGILLRLCPHPQLHSAHILHQPRLENLTALPRLVRPLMASRPSRWHIIATLVDLLLTGLGAGLDCTSWSWELSAILGVWALTDFFFHLAKLLLVQRETLSFALLLSLLVLDGRV